MSIECCEPLLRPNTNVRWSQGTGAGGSISLRVKQSASAGQKCFTESGRTEYDVGEAEEREDGPAGAQELPVPLLAIEDAEAVDDEWQGDDEVDDGEAGRLQHDR